MEVLAVNSPAIKEALDFEKEFNQDKESLRKYELREKAVKDYYSFLSAERDSGKKEGIEIGEKRKALDVAQNLLKAGINISLIKTSTGLSDDELMELKNSI